MDLAVDGKGNCLVLSSPLPGTTRLRRFGPDGKELGSPRPLPDTLKLTVGVDGRLYGLSDTGLVRLLDAASPALPAIDPADLIHSGIVALSKGRRPEEVSAGRHDLLSASPLDE